MEVAFQTFEQYHMKIATGSSFIRAKQLLKYWPEAGLYTYGSHPKTIIFQKVFVTQDYQFPAHYPGIRILDVCDPVHLEGVALKETVDAMHAVTCPTDNLAKFLRQLTDKPVVVIPDRFDISIIPKEKVHSGDSKTVVWFGYRHNAITIKPAMQLIQELGLKLIVIADDDPFVWQWLGPKAGDDFRRDKYRYIKYNEDMIYQDLQRADFAILPEGTRPVDHFKSNNKTVKAILAGLPVAKTSDDMRRFMSEAERKKFLDSEYEKTKAEYDCRKSVDQYKELIAQLQDSVNV